MKAKNNNLTTLEEFKEKNYGKIGTKERDELEAGYENFKIGALIHDARIEKGMTCKKSIEINPPRKEIKTKDIWNDQKQDDLKKIILSHSEKQ